MRVFVTGAAGFIGQAVTRELIEHGHQVSGLARSDASAQKINNVGGEVQRGDLEDIESLKAGAKEADGVVHLAFIHDFSPEGIVKALATDRAAIEAMSEALAGTGKPLVIASGTMIVSGIERANENTPPPQSDSPFAQRGKSETLLQQLSKEKNVRGIAIRLAPTVHGEGDQGFVTILANVAKGHRSVISIGAGSTRWPAVHRLDAARLFRLALEKGEAGAIYHGVAEGGIPTGQIMEAIGKKLKMPVESLSVDEAVKAIGMLAYVVGADNQVSSEKTQKNLSWKPAQLNLIEDIQANYAW